MTFARGVIAGIAAILVVQFCHWWYRTSQRYTWDGYDSVGNPRNVRELGHFERLFR